jgi:hypothetical protein
MSSGGQSLSRSLIVKHRGCGKTEEIWKELERMRIFQRNTLNLNDI